jgi:hypothetical protein
MNGEGSGTPALERPAFYALPPGGWRDLVTILHLPYTLWTLGYVALGAAAAPDPQLDRFLGPLAAIFLAVGLGAHALDELQGRPLQTRLSDGALIALAAVGLGGALAVCFVAFFVVSASLIPLVAVGAFLLVAYNLELFEGRFHTDFWFAAIWGAFPAFAAWWTNALGIDNVGQALAAAGVTLGCFFVAAAQRRLSTPVRELRRRTESVEGTQRLSDGTVREISATSIAAPLDAALRALSVAIPLLGAGLLAVRL